ncbi:MAG TPA: hypothetical protein PKA61_12300 [Nitrospira sp.]|nr:hypothetical protein [Nitrospira sp.]
MIRHLPPFIGTMLTAILSLSSAEAANAPTTYLDADLGQNLESLGRLYEDATKGGLRSASTMVDGLNGKPVPVLTEIIRITQVFSTQDLRPAGTPTIQGGGTNISRNGSCVVGYQDSGPGTPYHAFRWLQNGASSTPLDLGSLGSATLQSFATDTNQDCSAIVGYGDVAGGATQHAVRWTSAGGMEDLNVLAGAAGSSRALGVSTTGSVIVGEAEFSAGGFPRKGAFLWSGGAFTDLIPGGTPSLATAVSADGTVVVGQVGSSTASHAFRWKQGEPTLLIGPLGSGATADTHAAATAVNDNGKIVVGISHPTFLSYQGVVTGWNSGTAFRWAESGPYAGIKDLRQLLVDNGVTLDNITLVSVTGISPDGQWIQGKAQVPGGETTFVAQFCDENIVGGIGSCSTSAAPFTLGASPDQLSVPAGQNVSTTITVTPNAGFNQPVSFACGGLPVGASCSFNPATVTPAGGAIDTTLTITTNGGPVARLSPGLPSAMFAFLMTPFALALAGLLLYRPTMNRHCLWTGLPLILAIVATSCSGGDSSPPPVNSSGGAPATGTPAGTSNLTVTASSASGNSTVPITVNVTR